MNDFLTGSIFGFLAALSIPPAKQLFEYVKGRVSTRKCAPGYEALYETMSKRKRSKDSQRIRHPYTGIVEIGDVDQHKYTPSDPQEKFMFKETLP